MSSIPEAKDHWLRAVNSFLIAELGREVSPDDAASRAYYAVFHAVSALFALEGKGFKKHSAVENEVHFGLVRSGRWSVSLGDRYKKLHRLRMVGDYGSLIHVSAEEAKTAISDAREILLAVSETNPAMFPFDV
ncbi:MAG: HEPN domain-containing protein [bacterium]